LFPVNKIGWLKLRIPGQVSFGFCLSLNVRNEGVGQAEA